MDMDHASLGLAIVSIVALGYASNWLNWRFLNYRITHLLYYVGAFVHESSHAALCVLTGTKIYEFKVFSSQPHVTHAARRPPFIREFLISSAPIFGGLLFLFLVNQYVLGGSFTVPTFDGQWQDLLMAPIHLIREIRLYAWQSWVMIALFINIGAMLGPSIQDIKNSWPVLVLLFFVSSPVLVNLCFLALCLIAVNIIFQIALIIAVNVGKIGALLIRRFV